jgi:hypothetical protein
MAELTIGGRAPTATGHRARGLARGQSRWAAHGLGHGAVTRECIGSSAAAGKPGGDWICGREKRRETLALCHVRRNEPANSIPKGTRSNVQGNFTYESLHKGEAIQYMYL